MTDTTATSVAAPAPASNISAQATAFTVILAVSFCHCVNDIMQSLLSAIYPLLKDNYGLDFWQIGLLTFAKAKDDMTSPAPPLFGNRNLTSVPVDRRYRSSFVFAAARNP